MAEANDPIDPQPEPKKDDATYYQAEAKKAFAARDELKAKLREYENKVLSDEDRQLFETLKAERDKAEETRKRKAGEFDQLREQLTAKHAAEIAERETKFSSLSERFKNTVIKAEFGAASAWFGGEGAKTILDVELAMAALGKYVAVEDAEDDPLGFQIVVKSPRGERILGKDGNPAPFADAIGELIAMLPNRDRILRGSGKTGSGSSGGSNQAAHPADLNELIRRVQQGDKAAIEQLRARRAASGGIQMGSALQTR